MFTYIIIYVRVDNFIANKMAQTVLRNIDDSVQCLYFPNPYELGYLEPNQGIQNQYF